MTRPTDCTTSIWELRAERNSTASSEGTSTPSERQRTLVRMRHSLPSAGAALSHDSFSSRVVAGMVPSTCRADTLTISARSSRVRLS